MCCSNIRRLNTWSMLFSVYLSEEVRIRLRYYRSYRSYYYYYYYSYGYSYHDNSLSTAAIVGIVIGSVGGLFVFVLGCVFCCVCCCGKSSSSKGQVINAPSQTQTVATISTSQMTAVVPSENNGPNFPVQDPSLQQQPDGYKYYAPPPSYGQAVNHGFQGNWSLGIH